MQQICDRVAIINHGELIRLASVTELLDASGEYVVYTDRPDELIALLKTQRWAGKVRVHDGAVVTGAPNGRGRDLIQFLAQSQHWPDSVAPRQQNLEEIFLSLTGDAK